MRALIFFLCITTISFAALAQLLQKPGDKLELSLRQKVKTWERVRNGKTEYVKYCTDGDKAEHCSKFVGKDGKVAKPETKANVLADGTLIIEKLAKHDAADYSTPDEKHSPNVAGTVFNVNVE